MRHLLIASIIALAACATVERSDHSTEEDSTEVDLERLREWPIGGECLVSKIEDEGRDECMADAECLWNADRLATPLQECIDSEAGCLADCEAERDDHADMIREMHCDYIEFMAVCMADYCKKPESIHGYEYECTHDPIAECQDISKTPCSHPYMMITDNFNWPTSWQYLMVPCLLCDDETACKEEGVCDGRIADYCAASLDDDWCEGLIDF